MVLVRRAEIGKALDNVVLNRAGKDGTPASRGVTGGSLVNGIFSSPLTGYSTLFPSYAAVAKRTTSSRSRCRTSLTRRNCRSISRRSSGSTTNR